MKRTPFYETHLTLGGKMVEFGGWEMPLNYPPGILEEHLATRKFGGLFDISHMGRFSVRGQDALPFLQRVLSSNVAAIEPGLAQYTMIPSETGGAIDDACLYQIDSHEYWLVVNAANTEKDWNWIQKYTLEFKDLHVRDITATVSMLSLQGPRTKGVLQKICGNSVCLPEPGRNKVVIAEMLGDRVVIARTGYAGEPIGFELFPPAPIATSIFELLLSRGKEAGVIPVGLGARDTLRLEANLPLYGHEIGMDSEGKEIPVFALPLARIAVSFSSVKGNYVGREALGRQFAELQARQEGRLDDFKGNLQVPKLVRPLALNGTGVPRAGYVVFDGDKPAGIITSGTVAPYWKFVGDGLNLAPGNESGLRAVCLAYLDARLGVGHELRVQIRDKSVGAVVIEKHLALDAPPYAVPQLGPEKAKPFERPPANLPDPGAGLVKRACANTAWRQTQTINLIPSEQSPSPLVKLLSITDPAGRYAEHRKIPALQDFDAYYYQGTGFISSVESELAGRMRSYLRSSQIEVRPTSGQMANTVVFSAMLDYLNAYNRRVEPRRIRSVMMHGIGKGGHLSAQPMGALRNFVRIHPVTERWSVVNFPVLARDPYRIDVDRAIELIHAHRPELIVFGKSLILYPEPVKEISRAVIDVKPRPIIMYDAAHVLGLLGPYFQEPFSDGADIITASTHKTFFGTQRGLIGGRIKEDPISIELWKSIERRAFPGSVSNHHLGTLLGLLMATYEMQVFGSQYQQQVITNARAFAAALKKQGLQVEGDPAAGYTGTHQVVIRVGYTRGIQIADRLEENNIIVNYQALPDDEGFTTSSGIRMGVQEMTRFGMKEDDFTQVAEFLADIVLRGKRVPVQVAAFRQRFTAMQYCLPEELARPLIDDLVSSVTR